jgi:hypothetical protein
MKFRSLQENLRRNLLQRIDEGQLTGLRLAQLTGFKQAHISNFLNRKRGLSVEGMDRVLTTQRLSVLDLLDPNEVNKRASIPPPSEDDFENVLVVEGITAADPSMIREHVRDILKFKRNFLRRLRSEIEGDRDRWERFAVVKAPAREAMSMFPRLLPGATVLIDRHYNSLKPYRRGEANMYAVRKGKELSLKYVEVAGDNLILRPHNTAYPVEVVAMDSGTTSADYIVGRICHVGIET